MQVSSSEGVANHTVPESCAGPREGVGEALTRVRLGWLLSRENNTPGTPTLCTERKATRTGGASASAWPVRRGRRPQHGRKLLVREPGDPASDQDQ